MTGSVLTVKGGMAMIDRERVINDLNVAKLMLCNPQMLTPEMYIRIGQAITKAVELLKQFEVREMTIDEWRAWKNAKNRDPICMIYKQDDTHTPIWVLDPNKVHEPALLMGEIKLFTGKLTFEQRKAVKWK